MQMEDQILPKKCGHLNDKRLVTTEEMCAKVTAAKRARRDLRIIARTDAVQSEGLDGAIVRMNRYIEAGADIAFADALVDEHMFRTFTSGISVPFIANMAEFGRTPYYTATQFEAMGCKLVIWPASSLRIAARAMEKLYATIAKEGETRPLLDDMLTRAELYEVINYFDFESLDASVARSVVPPPADEPTWPDNS